MRTRTNSDEYKQIVQELAAIRKDCQSRETSLESLKNHLEEITKKLERDEKESANSFSPISSILKDEIILISFLILYVGILSTDSYYSYFGMRYQLLHLPSFHIVYKGLTVLRLSPVLLIPYSLTVILLGFDFYAAKKKWIKYLHFRVPGIYLILLLLLALTYPLAVNAGRKGAQLDLQESTSTLPRIMSLSSLHEGEIQFDENYRLLIADSDYVVIFVPVAVADGGVFPHIKRYAKGEVYVLETSY